MVIEEYVDIYLIYQSQMGVRLFHERDARHMMNGRFHVG